MFDFAEDVIVDAAFVAEADGSSSFDAEELAEDFAVTFQLFVAHAIVVGVFFAQAGQAARVAAGEVVVDGGKIFEVLSPCAFEMG